MNPLDVVDLLKADAEKEFDECVAAYFFGIDKNDKRISDGLTAGKDSFVNSCLISKLAMVIKAKDLKYEDFKYSLKQKEPEQPQPPPLKNPVFANLHVPVSVWMVGKPRSGRLRKALEHDNNINKLVSDITKKDILSIEGVGIDSWADFKNLRGY